MRKAILQTAVILAAFFLGTLAQADSSFTVTLDPSESNQPHRSTSHLELQHETLGATLKQSKSTAIKYTNGGNENVVGWVGEVTAASAEIKRDPSRRSRTLFSCPRDTYLAILGQHGSWYGVLMVDSSTGWVEKQQVNVLNYQVVSPKSPSSEWGSRIINTALKYLGIPYIWGGYSSCGLDCSGFVKTVFARNGISLPRVARDQAQVGMPVGLSQLQAGDRLYFSCKGRQIDHAGIYMGNGLFIHSSVSRHGVAVDSISKPLFARSLVVARRL